MNVFSWFAVDHNVSGVCCKAGNGVCGMPSNTIVSHRRHAAEHGEKTKWLTGKAVSL